MTMCSLAETMEMWHKHHTQGVKPHTTKQTMSVNTMTQDNEPVGRSSAGRLRSGPQTSKSRGMWSNDQSLTAGSGPLVQSDNGQESGWAPPPAPISSPARLSCHSFHIICSSFPGRSAHTIGCNLQDNGQQRLCAKADPLRPYVSWHSGEFSSAVP